MVLLYVRGKTMELVMQEMNLKRNLAEEGEIDHEKDRAKDHKNVKPIKGNGDQQGLEDYFSSQSVVPRPEDHRGHSLSTT